MDVQILENLWMHTNDLLKKKSLFVVCNTKAASCKMEQGNFQMDTEYFSDDEFEEVASMFGAIGIPIDFFTYEDDFFNHVLTTQDINESDLLVYNAAQSGVGAGRKSLVPAFCNLHNLICTGSDAYVVSLCRHKYHVNKILAQANIRVPQTWMYTNEWLLQQRPAYKTKIIIKPIYESASIGIDKESVQVYGQNTDQLIRERVKWHQQPIIAQEFIDGYEAEVPLVRIGKTIYSLGPVGISIDGQRHLGDVFLDYKRIYFDRYEFYDIGADFHFSSALNDCAVLVASVLGMQGLSRVDFRINKDGSFFVTDVSTNPHFISHSSVDFSFRRMRLSPIHIAKTILSSAIMEEN